jgi:hypothetical protein
VLLQKALMAPPYISSEPPPNAGRRRADAMRANHYLYPMKKLLHFIFALVLVIPAFSQSLEEKELVEEGMALYKREMASWYGTDIFLERFGEKRQRIGGYLSYLSGENAVCVFFSNGEKPAILGTITFDNTFAVKTAKADGVERVPSVEELDLIAIRQIALNELTTDKMFQFYEKTNPNLIPVIDEKGKRVYIITGPTESGVVLLGNDYLLTFNKNNKLEAKKKLHNNLIRLPYGKTDDGKIILSTIHTHLAEFSPIITATDICTLMAYSKYTNWTEHIVVSKERVSIWNCKTNTLLTMTKDAWDKIAQDQNAKK